MTPVEYDFLVRLLSAPGASSFESQPAALWREQAGRYSARVETDSYGNCFATFGQGKPRVMLAGHIDEIGLLITYLDEQGFCYFKGIGGWDPQQLIGQRVRIVGYKGEVLGVLGRKPIHLISEEDRKKLPKLEDLWLDIGANSKQDALKYVRPGDFAVIEQPVVELLNNRLVSKAIDNRIGAYIALEAARRSQQTPCQVVAVATVQEEIGGVGAAIAAHALKPDVAIAIDVTHATDVPTINKKHHGDTPFGSGPSLAVGSYVHRGVLQQLTAVAEAEAIPYTLEAAPRHTATDADDIAKNRGGVPTAVVSIPNRYMHSPSEMIDLGDLEQVIRLIAAFITQLDAQSRFVQP